MSVLRVREKFGWFVCITLLIILSCRGVQSQKDEEEPEPASNILKRDLECDFSGPMICGYNVWLVHGPGWTRLNTTSGYTMSFKSFQGKSYLISPFKKLTDSCVQIDYKISGGRRCMLAVTTDPDKKLKFRLTSSSVGRAQFYVKNAVIAIKFITESYRTHPGICHIQIEKVSIRNGTCPALVCPHHTRACLDQTKCISHSSFCDRIPDCLDKSDEATCPKSISCDFENRYLCGYNIIGYWHRHKVFNPDLRLNNSVYSMRARIGGAPLSSPVMTIPDSCLQFAYAGEKEFSLIVVAEYSNGNTTSKLYKHVSKLTKWTVKQFDLPAGTVQVKFITIFERSKIFTLLIDNVKLTKGTCQKLE